jgi:hypothetical protein
LHWEEKPNSKEKTMKNMILRFTLAAVMVIGAGVTPALADGPGPPPGSGNGGGHSIIWSVLLSSLIAHL